MLDDLPELTDLFSDDKDHDIPNEVVLDNSIVEQDINISISKDNEKWFTATFIDVAPNGIGIHVLLPISIDFQPGELNNIQLKFERKVNDSFKFLKKIPVLVRWQERDNISGRMKLGLHFHGEIKEDPDLVEIIKSLQTDKS